MSVSIKTKLSVIIGCVSLVALICLSLTIVYFYNRNIDILINSTVHQSSHLVDEQIRLDTQKLGSALEALRHDEIIQTLFAGRDRDRLYRTVEPLFTRLKSSYGITHLYFHLPDGKTFLRVHRPELYGDPVGRITFEQARRTGAVASGLELGKTAFALRIVAPLHRGGQLIGYIELGEEIDHFLEFLEGVTGDGYAMAVNKKMIDTDAWRAQRRNSGLPDSWDQMREWVLISKPTPMLTRNGCLNDRNASRFSSAAGYDDDGRFLIPERVCAGYPLRDAAGQSMGTLITMVDVTPQATLLDSLRKYGLIAVMLLYTTTFTAILFLMQRHIIRPIDEIARAARIYARGDLKQHRITITTRDEIGQLGESVNDMASQLDSLITSTVERSVELENLNRSLEALATTDGLTGLCNHRQFYLRLQDEVRRSRRYNHPLSLIMADIDFFKKYNDTYGHIAGDALLRSLSAILKESARDIDVVARYGGEEFAVILLETTRGDAMIWAERVRRRISDTTFSHAAGQQGGHLTISIGVAELSDRVHDVSDFVQEADRMLYRAKNNGRNRVES